MHIGHLQDLEGAVGAKSEGQNGVSLDVELLVAEQELVEDGEVDEVEKGIDGGQVEKGLLPFGICHLDLLRSFEALRLFLAVFSFNLKNKIRQSTNCRLFLFCAA